ncbi:DUF1403 family protein [Mesorhizobium sp. 128a]
MRPDSELLAWWLADLVLAQSLRWPLPLLMAQAFGAAFRGETGGKRIRPGDSSFDRAVCLALVQATGEACRLAGEFVASCRKTHRHRAKIARQGRRRCDLLAAQ